MYLTILPLTIYIYIYYTNILIRGIKQWSKYPTTEETNGKKNEGLESRK